MEPAGRWAFLTLDERDLGSDGEGRAGDGRTWPSIGAALRAVGPEGWRLVSVTHLPDGTRHSLLTRFAPRSGEGGLSLAGSGHPERIRRPPWHVRCAGPRAVALVV